MVLMIESPLLAGLGTLGAPTSIPVLPLGSPPSVGTPWGQPWGHDLEARAAAIL